MAQEPKESQSPIVKWYYKADQFFQDNQQLINIVGIAIIVIVGGYLGYQKLYYEPRLQTAQEQMFMAQKYFQQDSLNLAIRGDGNYPGFETIATKYSGTPAANLSHYYLGISYLRMDDYQSAVEHLKQFEANDVFLSVISKGALGDAYMELGQKKKAVKQYEKAADKNTNKLTGPIYLFKAGLAYEDLGQMEKAHKLYKKIKNKYPESDEAQNIDKYIARVSAQL